MGFVLLNVESMQGWLAWCLVKVMYYLAHEFLAGAYQIARKQWLCQGEIHKCPYDSMLQFQWHRGFLKRIFFPSSWQTRILHHLICFPIRWWNSWWPFHASTHIRSKCTEISETSAVPGGAWKKVKATAPEHMLPLACPSQVGVFVLIWLKIIPGSIRTFWKHFHPHFTRGQLNGQHGDSSPVQQRDPRRGQWSRLCWLCLADA